MTKRIIMKGGKGSGHFGHRGRPGKQGGSQPAATAITEYLHQISRLRGSMGRLQGNKYQSYEELILKHGKYFHPAEGLPKGCKRGRSRECYMNASKNMYAKGLTYTEGYAIAQGLPFPVEHAWLTDDKGFAYELTWPEPGQEYFGVRMDRKFVNETMLRTETYGILGNDWQDEHRLLREGFPLGALK